MKPRQKLQAGIWRQECGGKKWSKQRGPLTTGMLPASFSATFLVYTRPTYSECHYPQCTWPFHINQQSRKYHNRYMATGQSDGANSSVWFLLPANGLDQIDHWRYLKQRGRRRLSFEEQRLILFSFHIYSYLGKGWMLDNRSMWSLVLLYPERIETRWWIHLASSAWNHIGITGWLSLQKGLVSVVILNILQLSLRTLSSWPSTPSLYFGTRPHYHWAEWHSQQV